MTKKREQSTEDQLWEYLLYQSSEFNKKSDTEKS